MENDINLLTLNVSLIFSTQTSKICYEVFCNGARYDFICHNRISEKNFFTGYGHNNGKITRCQYMHIEYIVGNVMIFKIQETNIVIDYNIIFQRLFYDVVAPPVYGTSS